MWKGRTGTKQAGTYCFADWQVARMAPAAWDFVTAMLFMDASCPISEVVRNYHARLCALMDEQKKGIDGKTKSGPMERLSFGSEYPLEQLMEDLKASMVLFLQWVWAVLYGAMVVPSEAGVMPPEKQRYTFESFTPGCLVALSRCAVALDILGFQKELLADEQERPLVEGTRAVPKRRLSISGDQFLGS